MKAKEIINNSKTEREKKRKLNPNWGYGFVRRQEPLKIIKPTILEKNRERNSNWANILPFFIKFNFLITKRKYKPNMIINLDEVSLSSSPCKKQLQVVVEDELPPFSTPAPLTMSRTTALFTVCADGTSLPTIILV